jgi:hypothetical protein
MENNYVFRVQQLVIIFRLVPHKCYALIILFSCWREDVGFVYAALQSVVDRSAAKEPQ